MHLLYSTSPERCRCRRPRHRRQPCHRSDRRRQSACGEPYCPNAPKHYKSGLSNRCRRTTHRKRRQPPVHRLSLCTTRRDARRQRCASRCTDNSQRRNQRRRKCRIRRRSRTSFRRSRKRIASYRLENGRAKGRRSPEATIRQTDDAKSTASTRQSDRNA